MSRFVTSTYRYTRPPRKKKPQAIADPAIVTPRSQAGLCESAFRIVREHGDSERVARRQRPRNGENSIQRDKAGLSRIGRF